MSDNFMSGPDVQFVIQTGPSPPNLFDEAFSKNGSSPYTEIRSDRSQFSLHMEAVRNRDSCTMSSTGQNGSVEGSVRAEPIVLHGPKAEVSAKGGARNSDENTTCDHITIKVDEHDARIAIATEDLTGIQKGRQTRIESCEKENPLPWLSWLIGDSAQVKDCKEGVVKDTNALTQAAIASAK